MIYRMGTPDPEWCRTCKGKGCDDCNWTGIQGHPVWLIPLFILSSVAWAGVLVYFLF